MRPLLRQLFDRLILRNITQHPNLKAAVHFSEIPCTWYTIYTYKAKQYYEYHATNNIIVEFSYERFNLSHRWVKITVYYSLLCNLVYNNGSKEIFQTFYQFRLGSCYKFPIINKEKNTSPSPKKSWLRSWWSKVHQSKIFEENHRSFII